MKLIFAVLDVSLTMGLTRFHKAEGFLHLYLQFLYIFHAISTRLGRQKSICILNFDEIPQSTAEIKLLPVLNDGWTPYWNFTSNFHFDLQCMCNHPHVMLHPSAKYRRNGTNIGGLLTSYRFFQDGGHGVGNLLLSLGLVTAFLQNGENLCGYQIGMRYLNPLLR